VLSELKAIGVPSKDCDGSTSFGQTKRNAATNPTITTSHHSHPTG
jgi:hypothetical protein